MKVALLGGSLAFSLVLCEGLARLLLPTPPLVRVAPARRLAERLHGEQLQAAELRLADRPDGGGLYVGTHSGRRLRANTLAVIENHRLSGKRIEIRTNSIGYRNREVRSKRGKRILFLGDSITFGDYLEEDETFVRRVEESARRRGRDWETINAGVGAVSLENELAILLETGLALDPDVVVLDFYLNDFLESPGVFVSPIPDPFARSVLLRHVAQLVASPREGSARARRAERHAELEQWLADFDQAWPARRGDYRRDPGAFNALIRRNFRDWGGAWSDHAWAKMEPIFAEFARLSRVHDFELYVLVFPVREQVEAAFVHDHPQQRALAIGREYGVEVLDLLPEFRRAHRNLAEALIYDQCHHTPRGAEVAASAVERFLDPRLDGSSFAAGSSANPED